MRTTGRSSPAAQSHGSIFLINSLSIWWQAGGSHACHQAKGALHLASSRAGRTGTLITEVPTAGDGRYATILADPPWNIQQKGGRSAERHYPLMGLEAITALRVDRLAAENSHCWLWVTNASVHAGEEVLAAWGFTYRSILTWIKPRLGLGNYLRNQGEHILLGTRGRAPVQSRGQGSWFYAPQQDHSHKPEEQFAIIERCSPGPYLELFARRKRPGWHAWGNEVDCDVAL